MPLIRLRDPKGSFPVGAVPGYGATLPEHEGDGGSYAIHFTVGQSYGDDKGQQCQTKSTIGSVFRCPCLLSNRERAQFGLIPNHHDVPVGEDKLLILEIR